MINSSSMFYFILYIHFFRHWCWRFNLSKLCGCCLHLWVQLFQNWDRSKCLLNEKRHTEEPKHYHRAHTEGCSYSYSYSCHLSIHFLLVSFIRIAGGSEASEGFTPLGNLESSIYLAPLIACFWTVGVSWTPNHCATTLPYIYGRLTYSWIPYMFLDCGSMPGYWEKTRAGTETTCKPNMKRSQRDRIRTLLLWGSDANHCTTVLPLVAKH